MTTKKLKKTWVKIRSGLLDPKHMEAIGPAVWLFIWLIDRADWDTGIVSDYTDDWPVADWHNKKSKPTIRKWRKILEDGLYVKFIQGQHSHQVIINRWINPRSYSGDIMNKGDKKQSPSKKAQGDKKRKTKKQGDTQGDTQDRQKVSPVHLSSQVPHSTQDAAAAELPKSEHSQFFELIMQATGLDPKIKSNASQIGKLAKELIQAEYKPGFFKRAYVIKRSWWAIADWRGKKGAKPTLKQIRDTIGIAKQKRYSDDPDAPAVEDLRKQKAAAQSEVGNTS